MSSQGPRITKVVIRGISTADGGVQKFPVSVMPDEVLEGIDIAQSAAEVASNATTTAATAQSTANTAKTAAATAQSTANTAKTAAETAQSTANTAKTIANAPKSFLDLREVPFGDPSTDKSINEQFSDTKVVTASVNNGTVAANIAEHSDIGAGHHYLLKIVYGKYTQLHYAKVGYFSEDIYINGNAVGHVYLHTVYESASVVRDRLEVTLYNSTNASDDLKCYYKIQEDRFRTIDTCLLPITNVISMYGADNSSRFPSVTATYQFVNGRISDKEIFLNSSTSDSTKKFKITVDDTGTITATEVTT